MIIPMHYQTENLSFHLDGLDMFLKYMKNGERVYKNNITFNDKLNTSNKVEILNYK